MTTVANARGSRSPLLNDFLAPVLLVAAIALAFGKSYFAGATFSGKPVTALIHLHTGLMVMWFGMLVAQAWFVRTGRLRVHRWVGRSSFAIVPLIILVTLFAAHESLNREQSIGADSAKLEAFTWGQVLAFAVTWGLAIRYRKRTPLHVRFMVSTLFAAGTAIVFRILFSWLPGLTTLDQFAVANWAVLTLMLLVLIAADWRSGIRASPFWVVTALIGIMHLAYFTVARSAGWLAFVEWFRDLPLPGR